MNLRHNRDAFREESPGTADRGRSAGPAAYASAALGAILAVAALVDQLGPGGLVEHAEAIYASDGVDASPALLYGLLYFMSAVAVILWLCVARATRARSRWIAPVMAGATVVVNVTLALTLLLVREYDARIFPIVWGVLALLPAMSGVVALHRSARGARVR